MATPQWKRVELIVDIMKELDRDGIDIKSKRRDIQSKIKERYRHCHDCLLVAVYGFYKNGLIKNTPRRKTDNIDYIGFDGKDSKNIEHAFEALESLKEDSTLSASALKEKIGGEHSIYSFVSNFYRRDLLNLRNEMKLNNYGFVEVGEWKFAERLKSGIRFSLNKFEDERVIYAFVVNDETKYIGICEKSTTTLEDRMDRYKSLQGAGTNERIAMDIKDCLKRRKAVKILALKPQSSLHYKGLDVDLVKGLENPLIEELEPKWNKQR
ncbi:MAG: hypothetical protein WA977_06855 [Halobacteriota archaeon]